CSRSAQLAAEDEAPSHPQPWLLQCTSGDVPARVAGCEAVVVPLTVQEAEAGDVAGPRDRLSLLEDPAGVGRDEVVQIAQAVSFVPQEGVRIAAARDRGRPDHLSRAVDLGGPAGAASAAQYAEVADGAIAPEYCVVVAVEYGIGLAHDVPRRVHVIGETFRTRREDAEIGECSSVVEKGVVPGKGSRVGVPGHAAARIDAGGVVHRAAVELRYVDRRPVVTAQVGEESPIVSCPRDVAGVVDARPLADADRPQVMHAGGVVEEGVRGRVSGIRVAHDLARVVDVGRVGDVTTGERAQIHRPATAYERRVPSPGIGHEDLPDEVAGAVHRLGDGEQPVLALDGIDGRRSGLGPEEHGYDEHVSTAKTRLEHRGVGRAGVVPRPSPRSTCSIYRQLASDSWQAGPAVRTMERSPVGPVTGCSQRWGVDSGTSVRRWIAPAGSSPPARRIRRSSPTSTVAPRAPRSSPLRANLAR